MLKWGGPRSRACRPRWPGGGPDGWAARERDESWQLPNGVRTDICFAEVPLCTIIYVRAFWDKVDSSGRCAQLGVGMICWSSWLAGRGPPRRAGCDAASNPWALFRTRPGVAKAVLTAAWGREFRGSAFSRDEARLGRSHLLGDVWYSFGNVWDLLGKAWYLLGNVGCVGAHLRRWAAASDQSRERRFIVILIIIRN